MARRQKSGSGPNIRNKLIHAARDLDYDKADRAVRACRDVSQWLNVMA
jgi:hypothetical protein